MTSITDYPFEIRHLSAEDGGGFLISYPDFSNCEADGETIEEAISEGQSALNAVIKTLQEFGHAVPKPNSGGSSGKFVQRVPKSLHARLAARAKNEGVSMNSLVSVMLAENLGVRENSLAQA